MKKLVQALLGDHTCPPPPICSPQEAGLRLATVAAVCAAASCAAALQLYAFTASSLKAASAAHNSKQNALDRAWKLASQGRQSIAAIPEELGRPDRDSIYSYQSDSLATIYFRQWHHAAEKLGWEWSFDRQTWHRTCMLEQVYQEGHYLTAADQALIQWLEIERALIFNSKKTRHSSILFPPALDLPSKLASPGDLSNLPKQVPDVFLCPISLGIMQAPAVTPSGMSYDRHVIESWIEKYGQDPANGQALAKEDLYPNIFLRDLIQTWLQCNMQSIDPAVLRRVTLEDAELAAGIDGDPASSSCLSSPSKALKKMTAQQPATMRGYENDNAS